MQSIVHSFFLTLLICTSFLIAACNKPFTQDELEGFLQNEKNGTKKTFESGDFKATVVYRPSDLLVKQELEGGQKNREELKNRYNQYSYFILSLQNKEGDFLNSTIANRQLFAAINEQLSFHMNENIYVLDANNDTAYLADFAFPRLYEMAKATSFLLAFKASDIKTDVFKICMRNILPSNETGVIKFEFDKKDIKNIPSLKL